MTLPVNNTFFANLSPFYVTRQRNPQLITTHSGRLRQGAPIFFFFAPVARFEVIREPQIGKDLQTLFPHLLIEHANRFHVALFADDFSTRIQILLATQGHIFTEKFANFYGPYGFVQGLHFTHAHGFRF